MVCGDEELATKITWAPTGYAAKRLSKFIKVTPEWENMKLDVMRDIIECKFTQNTKLKNLLLDGGYEEFYDMSPSKFWGVGETLGSTPTPNLDKYRSDNTLNNWCGKIIGEVRQKMLKKRNPHPQPT